MQSELDVNTELLQISLDSLEEGKKAYAEARALQTRVVELEKIASAKVEPIDEQLISQVVRNLVSSAFLEPEHATKLASDLRSDPSTGLRLVQRFIEISAPPFSEGEGVQKAASENGDLGDPDGWSKILAKGA